MEVIRNVKTLTEGEQEVGLMVNVEKTEYMMITRSEKRYSHNTLACRNIDFNNTYLFELSWVSGYSRDLN